MRHFKLELIDKLVNDYAEYLSEFSYSELKLIDIWNVFTFLDAEKLEKQSKKTEKIEE